jgi:hypothetical protein
MRQSAGAIVGLKRDGGKYQRLGIGLEYPCVRLLFWYKIGTRQKSAI